MISVLLSYSVSAAARKKPCYDENLSSKVKALSSVLIMIVMSLALMRTMILEYRKTAVTREMRAEKQAPMQLL